jgi:hypothetical protein
MAVAFTDESPLDHCLITSGDEFLILQFDRMSPDKRWRIVVVGALNLDAPWWRWHPDDPHFRIMEDYLKPDTFLPLA